MRLLPIVILASGAFCQEAPPHIAGEVSVDNGVSPKVVRRVGASLTDEAQMARLEGTVVLAVVVGMDGVVRDLRVVRSMGMGLDEKAIAAVKAPDGCSRRG